MFDPYDQWLSIGKEQRPITFYVLLGVSPEETDAKAIEQAADLQAELVSQYKEGQHSAVSARILNEIARAK